MTAASPRVAAVHVGRVAPLGPKAVPSGFRKTAVTGPVAATATGLAGDAQADHRVHGPPDKAVYAYPAFAYDAWRAAVPAHAAALVPGAMGENLIVAGADEGDVMIGDRVRIGTAVLVVTEPRQPCFKLGLAFGDAGLVRAFMRVGHSGWYYRVVEDGAVAAGDAIVLLDRPNPGWPVARFFAAITGGTIDHGTLAEMAALGGVSAGWALTARRLLGRGGG